MPTYLAAYGHFYLNSHYFLWKKPNRNCKYKKIGERPYFCGRILCCFNLIIETLWCIPKGESQVLRKTSRFCHNVTITTIVAAYLLSSKGSCMLSWPHTSAIWAVWRGQWVDSFRQLLERRGGLFCLFFQIAKWVVRCRV